MTRMTNSPLFRINQTREAGASDSNMIFVLIGLGIGISVLLGIMGWIQEMKDARMTPSQSQENKSITDPYHEPGAFTVTF